MDVNNVGAQTTASLVGELNRIREENLESALRQVALQYDQNISAQTENFIQANSIIDDFRNFLGSPTHILGNPATKHGEIAENYTVTEINGKAALHGADGGAVIDAASVPRTGPVDYIINGIPVQSKFYNGELNTLKAVKEHLDTYPDFVGKGGGIYHIPKDQHEKLANFLQNNTIDGHNAKGQETIRNLIAEIENKTGRSFTEVVQPAPVNYGEAQQYTIHDTVDKLQTDLTKENKKIVDSIDAKQEEQTAQVQQEHQPNWGEAGKATLTGAAVGGGLSLCFAIYKKYQEGRKLSDFTAEDWQDIVKEAGLNSLKGGISGAAIYALTNFAQTSAPVAGAIVAGVLGMVNSLNAYRKGEITFREFLENGEVLFVNAGAAAVGSMIGQALIPIPGLGALIGSVAGSYLCKYAKEFCNSKEKTLLKEYEERLQRLRSSLSADLKNYVVKLEAQYQTIQQLLEKAFAPELSGRIKARYSVLLAMECGVDESKILVTDEDTDAFFLD